MPVSSVSAGQHRTRALVMKDDRGKDYDWRLVFGLLVLPEALLGLLDKLGVIDMMPPAHAVTEVGQAVSAPVESPSAFAGYAWFIVLVPGWSQGHCGQDNRAAWGWDGHGEPHSRG